MHKRLKWLTMTALAASLLLPAGAMAAGQDGAQSYDATRKAAAEKAALLTGTYQTTSVQYALIDHGRIVVSGEAGRNDEKERVPLSADTMYGIGSTSKMFATAAVMKLVDEGKVDLDTPVVRYLPDFTMQDERYARITPRMLLNHSSGLYGSTFPNAFLFEDNDTYAHDHLLGELVKQKLKADPGAYSVYSNDGFTLAELLVERVSGTDFTSFIHETFTEPLGMDATKTPLDRLDLSRMAGLYFPAYKGQLPNETVNVIGAGGIYSTAEDLVRFSQIFTGQTAGILSDKAVDAMEQAEYKRGMWPDDADTSVNYGLGWDSVDLFPFGEYGIQALTKGGDTILYHASLVVLPDQNMAAAVLSSGGSSTTDQLLANEILLGALREKGAIAELKPAKSFGAPEKAPMPEALTELSGTYGATNQLLKVEVRKDGDLAVSAVQAPGAPAEHYVYTADGTFASADGNAKVAFVKETNGHTYVWVRGYASLPGLGQTALSQYSAEKLEANPIPSETAAAWEKRAGESYYLVNEKYSSLAYLLQPAVKIALFPDAPGYLLDQKILGPDVSASDLQIPTMAGRDTQAYRFYTDNGTEYMTSAGSVFVSGEAVKPIYAGKQSAATIPANGYAKWYKLSDQTAGKTMQVKRPADASFAVYDAQGTCVYFSVAGGKDAVVLPKNGTVAFVGDAGAKFGISVKP
ncbi:CubicO group peptidase, beta-lactamase class C family [Paenibacillus sp. UNC496MF]|uniref:serine hydrolase domain-containing protein n=1 Tax=Paenibacillus sp. UNC496MF TaxID=1502753 RepID=UPI0008E1AB16|nr:serine hydrolase domain-containing protein [Paenibacillus sp. UNC496MF]SFI39555.1 CubicO group peptidase, beta-lactamase class C family [Paenibacillus sp. UNC496MF]